MERFKMAIVSLCPHLGIRLKGAEILPNRELVFYFHRDQQIEPLMAMLRKYRLDAQIDIVDSRQYLFINCDTDHPHNFFRVTATA